VVLECANGKIGGELCGFSKVAGGCTLNNLRREFGEGTRRWRGEDFGVVRGWRSEGFEEGGSDKMM